MKLNGFNLKQQIKDYNTLKNLNKPIFQYNKKNNEFIRVYFVENNNKKELKLKFNEYHVFMQKNQFNFERIETRYITRHIFNEDLKYYRYYI